MDSSNGFCVDAIYCCLEIVITPTMQPWVVAMALATLMCFTSTCYFFQIPEEIRKKESSQAAALGIWGPPDAEFNWCEEDYQLSEWIAEPVNTASCVAMILLPLLFLATHEATGDVVTIACMEVVIAIGSMLFHATLRYSMQLADEIPMIWYVAAVVCSCLKRLKGLNVHFWAYGWVAILSIVIIATEQHSLLHEIFRGLMTLSFSSGLVVIGWGISAMASRLAAREDKGRRAGKAAARVLQAALLMFALSVVSWLLDNYHCTRLRHLPGGIPYPHLHTWWHVFIAVTLHCIMVLLHMDSYRHSAHLDLRFLAGLPVVHA